MQPPKQVFEKVKTDDFVIGTIDSYEYDEKHEFIGKDGTKVSPAIRFVFIIEGMEYPKKSKWMTFSYHEKSGLYLKYLSSLVKDAKPKMAFDLDQLVGMKIKMLWKDDTNPDYQKLDSIRPLGEKIIAIDMSVSTATKPSVPEKKLDVPF